jgi:hypothetical protein
VRAGLECLVYATVLWYVIQEYRHYKHEGWGRYFTELNWVQLDVINYVLFLLGICCVFERLSRVCAQV